MIDPQSINVTEIRNTDFSTVQVLLKAHAQDHRELVQQILLEHDALSSAENK